MAADHVTENALLTQNGVRIYLSLRAKACVGGGGSAS